MLNSGDTGFMMIATALVFFMTPGLAFFYGGLVRRKNVLNTMISSFFIMGLAAAMWVFFGYSLSFSGDFGGIIGSLKQVSLSGLGAEPGAYADTIPATLFVAFQMMFAIITPALITGSVAGRMKFKALFAFIALWLIVVYYPMAHMVWGKGGFLGEVLGSVDFAGGNVVHISSGVSGLVLSLLLGKRRGYEKTAYRTHNIPFVLLGASILWFGWFGFNAGSALAADGLAVHAFLTTNTSAACGLLSWMAIDMIRDGKPTVRNILAMTMRWMLLAVTESEVSGAVLQPEYLRRSPSTALRDGMVLFLAITICSLHSLSVLLLRSRSQLSAR